MKKSSTNTYRVIINQKFAKKIANLRILYSHDQTNINGVLFFHFVFNFYNRKTFACAYVFILNYIPFDQIAPKCVGITFIPKLQHVYSLSM